jgi:hypothetical protein
MEAFHLEALLGGAWVKLAGFEGGYLTEAHTACERALMSEKTSVRIRGCEDGEIVYERFYNTQDDPDVNWRDDPYEEDFAPVDWKTEGF